MTDMNKAKLSEYDFVVVLDLSGSMAEPNKGTTGPSRYEAAQESVVSLGRELQALDSDGLGLVLFSGSGVNSFDGVTVDKLKEVFATRSPRGGTPLDAGLKAALQLAGKSDKKDFIIVITDGVPDDKAAAAKVIVDASQSIETDDALTFLFIQVGDDAGATAYLKSLDDDLKGAKFDIVDTKTVTEADAFPSAVELIIAAIND